MRKRNEWGICFCKTFFIAIILYGLQGSISLISDECEGKEEEIECATVGAAGLPETLPPQNIRDIRRNRQLGSKNDPSSKDDATTSGVEDDSSNFQEDSSILNTVIGPQDANGLALPTQVLSKPSRTPGDPVVAGSSSNSSGPRVNSNGQDYSQSVPGDRRTGKSICLPDLTGEENCSLREENRPSRNASPETLPPKCPEEDRSPDTLPPKTLPTKNLVEDRKDEQVRPEIGPDLIDRPCASSAICDEDGPCSEVDETAD